MSSLLTRHPSAEQLLKYADGEVSVRDRDGVRSHLAACWQCRTEFEDIEQTIGDCVRYRKSVFDTCVPPPPAPWFDICARFDAVDAELGSRSLPGKLVDALRVSLGNPKRWVPVAATLALSAVIVYQFLNAPSVRAAALLQKAAAAADARPQKLRRVQVRMGTQSLVRVIDSRNHAAWTAAPAATPAATQASVESLFRAARYDWDDPLSARSFADWRAQLSDKHDEINTVHNPQAPERDRLLIRTTTRSGELATATLALRTGDLDAMEGSFLFRNNELVEVTELPDAPLPAPGPAATSAPQPRPEPAAPAVSPATPALKATVEDELRVFAALRRVGADLGDPIEVRRTPEQVLVTGVGVPPERQREIQTALEPLPRAVVRFSEPSAAGLRADQRAPGSVSPSPDVLRFQSKLEQVLGGRLAFERLTDQVLETSDAAMSRVHALRRLAERFPPQVEAQLGAEDRATLARMRREHSVALLERASELQRQVEPAMLSVGGARASSPGPQLAAASWQAATGELFQVARRAELLLAVALGGAQGEAVADDLPSRVLLSLAQLTAKAEVYQNLTTMAH